MEIILGVTGGIGAYKAAELARQLKREGADVTVVMTNHATRFITPLTLEILTGRKVVTGLFDLPESWEVEHIALADKGDMLLVAPATANIIGKFAGGIADDFLSTLYLSFEGPTVLAPAMNTRMFLHPVVRKNLETLQSRGVRIIAPETGELACGTTGPGRLAAPEVIVREVLALRQEGRPLAGKKVVVTAGPTREYLDPVRFISNPSSGKMGFALAAEALQRGAEVTLISGPVSIQAPPGARLVPVDSAEDMKKAVMGGIRGAHVLLMAAAVSDLKPGRPRTKKIKKENFSFQLKLAQTDDILTLVGRKSARPFLVGFAAETGDLKKNALAKLKKKHLDMIIANDVSRAGSGFGSETNEVLILSGDGRAQKIPPAHKRDIAASIWDAVTDQMNRHDQSAGR
jgi:phosphopantothenoylcysteine decarboxylase/phosphopantothenate--cysteine ligase